MPLKIGIMESGEIIIPPLISLSGSSGCGCKISPTVLGTILQGIPTFKDERIIVGTEYRDDAAVYSINSDLLGISTTDFFTPMVNDPFLFGQIAAANALSDVYAMGGTPWLALSILGWPTDVLPPEMAAQVVSGAAKKCKEAGITIAGGHSIAVKQPFFGLAVQGGVSPGQLKTNKGAQPGDLIFLTKPLGTGIASAAIKKFDVLLDDISEVIQSLTTLNIIGKKLGEIEGVNAMTDVTGFGFNGHLSEMAHASNATALIQISDIPLFLQLLPWLEKGALPDATYRNWNAIESEVSGLNDLRMFQWLNDPQTNGGLLISVNPDCQNIVQDIMKEHGVPSICQRPIGRFSERQSHFIHFE